MKAKWLLLASVTALSPISQADEYVCPPSIDITAKMSPTPAGWAGLYDNAGNITYVGGTETQDKLMFSGVTLYAGEPKNRGSLVPDNESQLQANGAEQTSIWSFGDVQEQQEYPPYLVCIYTGSRFGVFQKIAAPVKSCSWHEKAGETNRALTCDPL
ncbi:STY0301 family protein [Thiothrix nivea]|uniref:DUF3757 domain-containing protein n=1 Tax=Thiothrix nivea (strain ATCC 35100 / DSM 5205 / JP2) TaxID=870187 RepID=A0A656HF69_THINJ|nr:STY0301 family protein [Thiothrix nivea]EIJ35077.1 hypothetical protein Thini_2534 [Thiothrix nivea DSM 5205]